MTKERIVADQGEEDGQGLPLEEYEWLQAQLAAAARLAGGEEEEEDAADWVDPTNGPLRELLEACEDGSAEDVQRLLQNFPGDVNSPGPDGDTALHLACLYGHLPCVEALLAGGADVNIVNRDDGSTALHDAAAGGYLDICKLILAKADASIIGKADEDGDTPLHNAARGNHAEVVQLLLARGADPRVQNGYGNTPAEESDEQPVIQLLQAAVAAAEGKQ